MNKKISIVGIGMDGINTITEEGKRAIEQSEILIGAKRMLNVFPYALKPSFASYISSEIAEFIHNCEYEKIAVLMSGDCGFYSGAEKLLPLLSDNEAEVISGIASPVYFCSKLKIPWQNVHFVNLHGIDGNIIRNVCTHQKVFFLLGSTITPKDICRKLCEYEMKKVKVHIGENLSHENEHIYSGEAEEFVMLDTDNLSVIIVENSDYERYTMCGIPDDKFVRGSVPMTKSEVRCVCVSKLEISKSDICWDIGSGTGSVSVEMAMQCENGKVYAVDKNSDAAMLIDKNRHKFGCDNIEIIHADAADAVSDLPTPDCVFIGGSGGKIDIIINTVYKKNTKVRIVVTAVSLETLNESVGVFEKYGVNSEVSQIAVTKTRKVGNHTMLSAENPIFIIRGLQQ